MLPGIVLLVLFFVVLPSVLTLLSMQWLRGKRAWLAIPIGPLVAVVALMSLLARVMLWTESHHAHRSVITPQGLAIIAPIQAIICLIFSALIYFLAKKIWRKRVSELAPDVFN